MKDYVILLTCFILYFASIIFVVIQSPLYPIVVLISFSVSFVTAIYYAFIKKL